MADTGFKTTGTVYSTGGWNNLTTTRLNTSDNSRAAYPLLGSPDYGILGDYTFGLPSGATIDGILINVEFSDFSSIETANIHLSLSYNGGTNYTSEKSDSVAGNTDTVKTYGGSGDTWGRSWTDTELDNTNFRVKMRASIMSADARVDYFEIKVYYTEPIATDTRNARSKGKIITSSNRNARSKGKTATSNSRSSHIFGGYLYTHKEEYDSTTNYDSANSNNVEWLGDGTLRLKG